jgi:U3 small nucleolar RNA-associated protein 15
MAFLLRTAGSLLVTAGGNSVCVWDVVGGGRLLKKLTNFQKTVSCVRLSPLAGPDSAAAPRLLAGSLDGHVKVGDCCPAVDAQLYVQRCIDG